MKASKTLHASLFLLTLPVSALAQGQFSLSTGVDYSTGDFGADEDTDITYVPVTAKYDTDRWFLRLTVPYLRIRGPGQVVLGPDGDPLPIQEGGGRRRTTEDGLGDIVAGATYNVLPPTETGLIFDIGAKIKFPTADEDKRLGTGEEDYSLQGDLTKAFGRWITLGTLGYRWLGDPPGISLRNVFFGTLGALYKVSDATTAGLLYDWREKTVSGSDPLHEVTAYVGYRFNPSTSAQFYLVTGFSDSSADFGIGTAVSYGF
jgi:hypothetical protein